MVTVQGRKRAAPSRSERTRLRIMLTAERLFGSQGINGPSMRHIAQAADQSNASVIQYHFDDRDNLIREIMNWRVLQMEPIRERMLKAAERSGLLQDLATLLRIICLPHLELRDEDNRYPYSEFMLEFMMRYRGPAVSNHPFDYNPETVPNLVHTLGLIRDRLYYIDGEIVQRREMAVVVMVLQILISANEQGATEEELAYRVEDAILMGTHALMAPLPPTPGPLRIGDR